MKKHAKLLIALSLFLITGVLVIRYVMNRPPDPETADVQALLTYAMGEQFKSLDPDRQQVYIESLYRQMEKMNAEQSQQVRQIWQERIDEASDDALQQFAISIMGQKASEYVSLPPDQRRAWLEANQGMMKVGRAPGNSDGLSGGAGQDAVQMESAMGFADLLKGSSGPQRAAIGIMLNDLQAMQEHNK